MIYEIIQNHEPRYYQKKLLDILLSYDYTSNKLYVIQ
jgi:hypothetical protein